MGELTGAALQEVDAVRHLTEQLRRDLGPGAELRQSGGKAALLDKGGQSVHRGLGPLCAEDHLAQPGKLLRGVLHNVPVVGGMEYRQPLAMVAVGIGAPSWCSIWWHSKSVTRPTFRMPFSAMAEVHIRLLRAV